MASTAASVAVAMEVIAALGEYLELSCLPFSPTGFKSPKDLFYDIRLNAGVAVFSIFSTQMLGGYNPKYLSS